MDMLDRVRDIGSDIELDESRTYEAEVALKSAIADVKARKRWVGWAIGGGLGAAVLAGAAAVAIALTTSPGSVVLPPPEAGVEDPPVVTTEPSPEPSFASPPAPTAQNVLEKAAALAFASAGSEIADGRYLRVENLTRQLVLYAADAPGSPYNATRQTATAAWVSTGRYTQYIPADRSREWVTVFESESGDYEIAELFGQDAEALAAQWQSQTGVGEDIVTRVQGGATESGDGTPPLGSDAYFAEMPLDPHALLQWNYDKVDRWNLTSDGFTPRDVAAALLLLQDLQMNAAPPPLRAAMFRALALVPGAVLVSTDEESSTIAYPFPDGSGRSETVTIGTETGLVLATTTTRGSGGTVVPDSVPDHAVTTTITVVDQAP